VKSGELSQGREDAAGDSSLKVRTGCWFMEQSQTPGIVILRDQPESVQKIYYPMKKMLA
jgi:hypothetical protein